VRKKYPERQIKSISELTKVIDSLDLDEGVRLLGYKEDFQGGGFIFISTVHSLMKSNQKYCINTAERILNEESGLYLPGGKEEFRYTSDIEEVMKYIDKNASKPLQAWYY
jgi:hypothetical protein|tara:strand:+ start:391 stop:720 length:330 start_codon:yes stop_codon:yes gene_type:complete